MQYEKARGMVRLSHRGEEISNKNIKDALKTAEIIPLNVAREIIHSVPQNFIVDGQKNIKNPVGLYGVKLEVETLLITSHLPFLQNIIKSLSLAGVELEDIIFSGIATSKSLLSQATEGKGIILLEIDNNFTSASFFFDNVLNGIDIQEESVISDGVLKSLKENVDKIRGEKPISKILLAGGGYIHEDFIEKVDSIFGIPSETAYLKGLKGTARDMNNPAHLTSAGLALYGLERRREDSIYKRVGSRLLNKVTKRVGNFLNEYF